MHLFRSWSVEDNIDISFQLKHAVRYNLEAKLINNEFFKENRQKWQDRKAASYEKCAKELEKLERVEKISMLQNDKWKADVLPKPLKKQAKKILYTNTGTRLRYVLLCVKLLIHLLRSFLTTSTCKNE